MAGSTGERKIMHSVVVRRFESRVSNRCLMDGDAYPLFPILPQSRSIVVPGRHSSLSLSLCTHTDVSHVVLLFPFSSFSSVQKWPLGQFVARAWTQSPASTQSLCVILDSVGMSDPLKGQHLILGQLWFTVLFPRIERLGRKKTWRIGNVVGWFLIVNCVVDLLENWNNSRWSEMYFKGSQIFRKIVKLNQLEKPF